MNEMLALKFQIGLALYVTAYISVTKNLAHMTAQHYRHREVSCDVIFRYEPSV